MLPVREFLFLIRDPGILRHNALHILRIRDPQKVHAVHDATRQARRHIPMTMADWASKLDAFLQFNDAEILRDKGKVTAAIAKAFAESEFEQYRVIQDRLYQSDFDRLVASTEQKN